MDDLIELPPASSVLLGRLTKQQQRLIDVVAEIFLGSEAKWPYFQYVQAVMDREGIDAVEVLTTLPEVRDLVPQGFRYGPVWFDRNIVPQANSNIGLTVAGLCHVTRTPEMKAAMLAAGVIGAVRCAADARRAFDPLPTEIAECKLTSAEVRSARESHLPRLDNADVVRIGLVLEHEPILSGVANAGSQDWSVHVDRGLQAFADATDTRNYLDRIGDLFNRRVASPRTPALSSPLGLHAGLDYFDSVWRLVPQHDRKSIVQLPGAERTAELSYPAQTEQEFRNRLSAIGEVLHDLQVPKGGDQKGGHAVERLAVYLRDLLPNEAHGQIEAATQILRCVVDIRNGLEHHHARQKAVAGLSQLGVGYPIVDWTAAWASVQAEVMGAFDMMRGELAVATR